MTLDSKNIAERLGATTAYPITLSDTGAFGMAELALQLKRRLDAGGGRRQGNAIAWILGSKIPMSAETERLLVELAEKLSTPEQRVNPIQLAAQLLEQSVQRLANQQNP